MCPSNAWMTTFFLPLHSWKWVDVRDERDGNRTSAFRPVVTAIPFNVKSPVTREAACLWQSKWAQTVTLVSSYSLPVTLGPPHASAYSSSITDSVHYATRLHLHWRRTVTAILSEAAVAVWRTSEREPLGGGPFWLLRGKERCSVAVLVVLTIHACLLKRYLATDVLY